MPKTSQQQHIDKSTSENTCVNLKKNPDPSSCVATRLVA